MEKPIIYEKMALILSEMKAIEKSQTNKMQGFKFRGVDQIYSALNPLLGKHGVFFTPKVLKMIERDTVTAKGAQMHGVYLEIEYTFYASDGSNVSCVSAGEALDSGDKATSKAMSIALKYALFQTFCIPTEEEKNNDPDNYSYEVQKKQQVKQPTEQEQISKMIDYVSKESGNNDNMLYYFSQALGREITNINAIKIQDVVVVRAFMDKNPIKSMFGGF